MLRHLQCRLPLSKELLQLLWDSLHPEAAGDSAKALLTPLVQASLLCFQPVSRQQFATLHSEPLCDSIHNICISDMKSLKLQHLTADSAMLGTFVCLPAAMPLL